MPALVCCTGCGPMHLADVYDTGSSLAADGGSYAHNVYLCNRCGAVAIERVWCHAGVTWVLRDGRVISTPAQDEG